MIYNGRVATIVDYKTEQSFEFELPDGIVGISISGGLDSTALFYLICRYINDLGLESKIKVLPIHTYVTPPPYSLEICEYIIKHIKNRYKNITILDLELDYFCDDEEPISGFKLQHKFHAEYYERIYKEYPDLKLITKGRIASAPRNTQKKWLHLTKGFLESENIVHRYHKINGVYTYNPLSHVNKKMVAALFNQLKIPKRIFKITSSCSQWEHQEYRATIDKPCEVCYSCLEKKWAFGEF